MRTTFQWNATKILASIALVAGMGTLGDVSVSTQLANRNME